MDSSFEAKPAGWNNGVAGKIGIELGRLRHAEGGAADVERQRAGRLWRQGLRAGCAWRQHEDQQRDRCRHTLPRRTHRYFEPFALRRSAQYLFIRTDTALRAAADIARPCFRAF